MLERKSFTAVEFKTLQTPGEFEAIFSVFNTPDQTNDIVHAGAFLKSIDEDGLPPVVWSHMWDEPPIGATLDAAEKGTGMWAKGRLFVDEGEDSPKARQVWTAMKALDGRGRPSLREFSFGYKAVGFDFETKDGTDYRNLREVKWFEWGPTLKGMHPDTQLLGVKQLADALAEDLAQREVTPEPADKPLPKDTQVSEEEAVRIGQLLLARPIHHMPQEG